MAPLYWRKRNDTQSTAKSWRRRLANSHSIAGRAVTSIRMVKTRSKGRHRSGRERPHDRKPDRLDAPDAQRVTNKVSMFAR